MSTIKRFQHIDIARIEADDFGNVTFVVPDRGPITPGEAFQIAAELEAAAREAQDYRRAQEADEVTDRMVDVAGAILDIIRHSPGASKNQIRRLVRADGPAVRHDVMDRTIHALIESGRVRVDLHGQKHAHFVVEGEASA